MIDSFGNPFLYHAVEKEDIQLIKLLIQLDCDINHVSRHDKDAVLHYACFQKNREIISILIENTVDRKKLNIYNKTVESYLYWQLITFTAISSASSSTSLPWLSTVSLVTIPSYRRTVYVAAVIAGGTK